MIKSESDTIQKLTQQRNALLKMLGEWCAAIDTHGGGWDDWDEYYKDAMFRKTDPPELRELLNVAIAEAKESYK